MVQEKWVVVPQPVSTNNIPGSPKGRSKGGGDGNLNMGTFFRSISML